MSDVFLVFRLRLNSFSIIGCHWTKNTLPAAQMTLGTGLGDKTMNEKTLICIIFSDWLPAEDAAQLGHDAENIVTAEFGSELHEGLVEAVIRYGGGDLNQNEGIFFDVFPPLFWAKKKTMGTFFQKKKVKNVNLMYLCDIVTRHAVGNYTLRRINPLSKQIFAEMEERKVTNPPFCKLLPHRRLKIDFLKPISVKTKQNFQLLTCTLSRKGSNFVVIFDDVRN